MGDSRPSPVVTSRRAYAGRLLQVDLDTIQNPAGQQIDLELVRHPGAAAIVPLLSERTADDPHILMIQQYRYAAGGMIWEIPAGVLHDGEPPEVCAKRELREETGAEAENIEFLTTVYTTPGFTDERIHLFLASGITVTDTAHEPDEYIKVVSRPLSDLLEMIRDGEIVDAKSITALLYVAGFTLLK